MRDHKHDKSIEILIFYSFIAFISECSSFVPLYRSSAEEAIQRMQGAVVGQQIVRVSWGRSPTAKQVKIIL